MAGFLDKVVVSINKGVNSVSDGSKTILEKAKINTQIQDIKKEQNQLYINLGKLIYNLQTRGDIKIEECSSICDEIGARDKKIKELEEAVNRMENLKSPNYSTNYEPAAGGKKCVCGHINKPASKFCANCGKPIAEENQEPQDNVN